MLQKITRILQKLLVSISILLIISLSLVTILSYSMVKCHGQTNTYCLMFNSKATICHKLILNQTQQFLENIKNVVSLTVPSQAEMVYSEKEGKEIDIDEEQPYKDFFRCGFTEEQIRLKNLRAKKKIITQSCNMDNLDRIDQTLIGNNTLTRLQPTQEEIDSRLLTALESCNKACDSLSDNDSNPENEEIKASLGEVCNDDYLPDDLDIELTADAGESESANSGGKMIMDELIEGFTSKVGEYKQYFFDEPAKVLKDSLTTCNFDLTCY
ncbi:MAG: hypothetical protein ACRCXZ_01650 [Patescibacteria group bacterium]